MCGFYGLVSRSFHYSFDELNNISQSIYHRGPDANGSIKEIIDKKHVYFNHNRLSIIDLTENGTQPFKSEDENYILIFNGEIYNFKEIREELIDKNIIFKTKTDTEVLLKAWIEWGEKSVVKLKGMFSFSILDKKKNKIFLVRDNFGMKPLYYYKDEENFFFASEIICILKLLKKKIEINFDRSYQYLIYGNHDDTNETFFKNIYQLRPGEILSINLKDNLIKKKIWWQPNSDLAKNITFDKAKSEIRQKFLDSVKMHLISDVKIGVALSGGIDSSSITCAIKHLNPKEKIDLISFIPKNKEDDESAWIGNVEKHLNENSNKVFQSKTNISNIIDELIEAQGEPFGDTTILAEYLIFKEAKKMNIKVLLMGHGGDEVFVGYDGFPGAIIKTLIENFEIKKLLKFCFKWKKNNNASFFELLKKISNEFIDGKLKTFLLNLLGKNKKPNWIRKDFLQKKNVSLGLKENKYFIKNNRNLANKQLSNVFFKNLPAMLRYADRSSMKNSIECRLPFLNNDLFSYCLSLPENYLVSDEGKTKYIFRESMKNLLPNEIFNRNDKIGYLNNDKFIFEIIEKTEIKNDFDLFNFDKLKMFLSKQNETDKNINLQKWRIINFLRWKNIFKEYLSL